MVYDVRHKLLTIHGRLWTATSAPEYWSMGVRFQPISNVAVSQAQANACHTAVAAWWVDATNGPFVWSSHSYTGIKLAPIGTDGRYPPGEQAYEGPAVNTGGTGATAQVWPGQCAVAVTLISSKPGGRGRASKGRVYLPPLSTTIGSDGRITASTATRLSTGIANLLGALNDITDLGGAAVFSSVGSGDHYPIVSVRTGTIVDTIRRRRRQMAENPTAPITVP